MSAGLGDITPDFNVESTEGSINFHQWIGNDWCILFSHPKDFTPVCTTELGAAAKLQAEFSQRKTKIIALSVDDLAAHQGWIKDIEETQHVKINYPIIADPDRKVAKLYNMLHPNELGDFTVRSVFFIGPDKKIKASITYPAATGRNFAEIIRVLDSLQLTAHHSIATPANWEHGDDCVIIPSISDEEAKTKFPKGFTRVKSYLRLTPQPNIDNKSLLKSLLKLLKNTAKNKNR